MSIGKKRHRITIETLNTTRDAYGQQVGDVAQGVAGTVFATLWAEVVDLSGPDLFSAQEQHSQVTTHINIRWYPGIVPMMQVRYTVGGAQTRAFDVLSVTDPTGRRRDLVIACKERVA